MLTSFLLLLQIHLHTVLSVSLQTGGLGFLIGTLAIFLQDEVYNIESVAIFIVAICYNA